MKIFRGCVVAALMLAGGESSRRLSLACLGDVQAGLYERKWAVIDPSDARKITTSEGQSYGLFFALAANDRKAFDLLLAWTRDNLARGRF